MKSIFISFFLCITLANSVFTGTTGGEPLSDKESMGLCINTCLNQQDPQPLKLLEYAPAKRGELLLNAIPKIKNLEDSTTILTQLIIKVDEESGNPNSKNTHALETLANKSDSDQKYLLCEAIKDGNTTLFNTLVKYATIDTLLHKSFEEHIPSNIQNKTLIGLIESQEIDSDCKHRGNMSIMRSNLYARIDEVGSTNCLPLNGLLGWCITQ